MPKRKSIWATRVAKRKRESEASQSKPDAPAADGNAAGSGSEKRDGPRQPLREPSAQSSEIVRRPAPVIAVRPPRA